MCYNTSMRKSTLSFHYTTLALICQVLVLVGGFETQRVFAEESETPPILSEEQRGAISMNCTSLKSSLHALQRSDSALRVHLGTTYQSILSRYLTPLNLRLVKNNLLSDELNSLLSEYSTKREAFNQQFISYSRQMESLLSIDCQSNPDEFYNQLLIVRTERANVGTAVFNLNGVLTRHIVAVKELQNV